MRHGLRSACNDDQLLWRQTPLQQTQHAASPPVHSTCLTEDVPGRQAGLTGRQRQAGKGRQARQAGRHDRQAEAHKLDRQAEAHRLDWQAEAQSLDRQLSTLCGVQLHARVTFANCDARP